MGRNGHVMVRDPEYGACITGKAQAALYDYLTDKGIEIVSPEACNTEDASQWTIVLPGDIRDGHLKTDYAVMRPIIVELREHPELVTARERGNEIVAGDAAADLLEQGVAAAKRHKTYLITIDWF